MPCFLSCKSRSVLGKPLEHQCSIATISPGCGANSFRISPSHVLYSKALLDQPAFWDRGDVLPGLVVARTIPVMHRIEDAKPSFPRRVQNLQHIRNTAVCLCKSRSRSSRGAMVLR